MKHELTYISAPDPVIRYELYVLFIFLELALSRESKTRKIPPDLYKTVSTSVSTYHDNGTAIQLFFRWLPDAAVIGSG